MSIGLFQENFYRVVSFLILLGTKPEHRLLECLQEDHNHPTPRVGGPAWTRRETNHKHRRTPQSPDRCSSEKKQTRREKVTAKGSSTPVLLQNPISCLWFIILLVWRTQTLKPGGENHSSAWDITVHSDRRKRRETKEQNDPSCVPMLILLLWLSVFHF